MSESNFNGDAVWLLSDRTVDKVVAFDRATGEVVRDFIAAGSGGLDRPEGIDIGADGNLYVASAESGQILRYDGRTGEFIDVFIDEGIGGLIEPTDVLFGPDGFFYVSIVDAVERHGFEQDLILRFDLEGNFVKAIEVSEPLDLSIGPDKNIYISGRVENNVKKLDLSDDSITEFLQLPDRGVVEGLGLPAGWAIGSDFDDRGNLYVANFGFDGSGETGIGEDPTIYTIETELILDPDRPAEEIAFLSNDAAEAGSNFAIPSALVRGEDNLLYVGSLAKGNILSYQLDGTFNEEFVPPGNITALSIGMIQADIEINGEAYENAWLTADRANAKIVAFDEEGNLLGDFIDGSFNGVTSIEGITIGEDNLLYVASPFTNQVLRYDATTGDFVDIFIDAGELKGPTDVLFGKDGHFYVSVIEGVETGFETDVILRYDLEGNFIESIEADDPLDLVNGPDGNIYFSTRKNQSIQRLNLDDNTVEDFYAPEPGTEAAIDGWAVGIEFDREGNLYVNDFDVETDVNGDAVRDEEGNPVIGTDNKIIKVNTELTTAGELEVFATPFTDAENNGEFFQGPAAVSVGEDGNIYINGLPSQNTISYDPEGNYLGEFISSDRLDQPVIGMIETAIADVLPFDSEYEALNQLEFIGEEGDLSLVRATLSGSDPNADFGLTEAFGITYGTFNNATGEFIFSTDPTDFDLDPQFEPGFVTLAGNGINSITGSDELVGQTDFANGTVTAEGSFTIESGEGAFANAEGTLNLFEFDQLPEDLTQPIPGLVNLEGEIKLDFSVPEVSFFGMPTVANPTSFFNLGIEFSEDVTEFTIEDLSLTNATASNFQMVDGNTYTVNITPDTEEAIAIDLKAGVANGVFNSNDAAEGVEIAIDNTPVSNLDDSFFVASVNNAGIVDFQPDLANPFGDGFTEHDANGFLRIYEPGQSSILRYNEDGSFDNTFVPTGTEDENISVASGLAYGPDGLVYINDQGTNSVKKYTLDGEFQGYFLNGTAPDTPEEIVIGDDGNGDYSVYVSSLTGDGVKRYDLTTGELIDDIALIPGTDTPLSAALMEFDDDGNLYIGGVFSTNQIIKYDPHLLGESTFVSSDEAQPIPSGIAFDDEGNLYNGTFSGPAFGLPPTTIAQYDAEGNLLNADFVDNSGGELDISSRVRLIDVDGDGEESFFVSNFAGNSILSYEGPESDRPGAFNGEFIDAAGSPLQNPGGLIYVDLPTDEIDDRLAFTSVFGTIEDDTIEVEGSGQLVFAGDNNDLVDAASSEGSNRIYAGSGDDALILGTGDRLVGGEGDDSFFALDGGGNTITGGAGADAFWIANAEIVDSANVITDFETIDVIGISGLGITSLEELNLFQDGELVSVSFNDAEIAKLQNIQLDNLNADNFAFA